VVIRVEAYAGYKAGERPLRIQLGDRWLAVEEVVDRWYDPDAVYFRVRAEDGAMYVLRHSEPDDVWTLEAYRRRDPAAEGSL
jgi:hypothetical protein